MTLTPDELGRINDASEQPKFHQIASRIRELIDSGRLSLGDRLPSVNEIIAHFQVSRDTAVKAYQELKDLGIIEATPNKACFVSNVLIRDDLRRVLFLVDSMTPYKERIYYGLLDTLKGGYYVDIMTHGDSFDILKAVYERYKSMRSCAALLVVPTASQGQEEEYFKYVNPGNLFFLDRRIPSLRHPSAWQDFRSGFYHALSRETAVLSKYRKIVFLTKFFTNPIVEEMKEGISRFADSANMAFEHRHTMFSDRDVRGKVAVEPGELFIVLDDHLLTVTLDACAERGLVLGKDAGVVVVNDGFLYGHLPVPVSVLTADFYAMGVAAANFILTGEVPEAPVGTSLIVRESV